MNLVQVGNPWARGAISALLVAYGTGCNLHAHVQMRITDMYSRPLKQLAVNEPAILELLVQDESKKIQTPVVEDLEALNPKNLGFGMIHAGNKQTIKYRYRIFASEPGTYTIGPVLRPKTNALIDNVHLTIKAVVADSIIPKQRAARSEPILRIFTSSKTPFVGEQFTVTSRFYYKNPKLALQTVTPPFCEQGTIVATRGPTQGEEELDETHYTYLEWEYDITAHKPGKLVIPACQADYEQYRQQNQSWGAFAHWIGARSDQSRVYSNTLTMQINSLPASSEQPIHIGSHLEVLATTNATTAHVGDGLLLSLEFSSDQSLELLKRPQLFGLPNAIKQYDSKENVEYSAGTYRKIFEYVLQTIAPGSHEVPAQYFTYFNTTTKAHETITTQPILLIVQPQAAPTRPPEQPSHTSGSQPQNTPLALHKEPWNPVKPYRPLDLWSLFLLFILPILWSFWPQICTRCTNLWPTDPFRPMRSQMARAQRAQNLAILYPSLQQLFAQICALDPAQLTPNTIARALREKKVDQTLIAELLALYTHLGAAAFAQNRATGGPDRATLEHTITHMQFLLIQLKEKL